MSNNYNSDGYIMIDLSDVDVTKSTQNVPGIYSRILNVIDANKLILIVNHKGLTPQAAICNKLLNYYVITTNLYIYKINSNDIVIIEQAGSSSVEVSIIPTLMSGTKIADFAIGSVEGELFAPKPESDINDNVTASNSTWSSEKIEGELELKADAADLAEVATSGSYNDLTNKPTIPTKTSDLQNDSGFITDADVPVIDDTTTATTKVWSSDKTAHELALKADATAVYTKTEVDNALSNKADSADVYTKSQVDTALSGITLDSNPASGDYHFELGTGWSVTNFVFNRVKNRIYMQGVFVKNSAFTPYEPFISLSSSSTKNINPYYETWFATMCDDGNGGSVSCERLQASYGSLRIASGNSNHRRIFVCASWISVSPEE